MNSALYVRRFSLNLIRVLIGNQCSDLSRGLDFESLLRHGRLTHIIDIVPLDVKGCIWHFTKCTLSYPR